MISALNPYVILTAGLIIGFVLAFVFHKVSSSKKLQEIEQKANTVLISAEKEANTIKKEALLEAKDLSYRMKTDAEREQLLAALKSDP